MAKDYDIPVYNIIKGPMRLQNSTKATLINSNIYLTSYHKHEEDQSKEKTSFFCFFVFFFILKKKCKIACVRYENFMVKEWKNNVFHM